MTNSAAPSGPEFFSKQITRARRFCLDPRPAPDDRLVVVCGGREQCLPDYEVHRTDFPFYSIEFVSQGKGEVVLRRKSFPLVAGTVFSYGPGVRHDIVTHSAETMVKYFVDFAGRHALRLLRGHGLPPGRAVQSRAPNELRGLFEQLIQDGTRPTPFTAEIASLLLRHLVLKIAETALPAGEGTGVAFQTFTRCKQYIEEHWPTLKTVQAVAAACGIDVAYLCRLFQRFDHQSPYEYLSSLRMREAAERLSAPSARIGDIADALGFADRFHFSRVFRRAFGVSPRRFAATVRRV